MSARSRAALARRLDRSVGDLAAAALAQMEQDFPWFRELSAEDRSWIGLVAQNGVASFAEWFRSPDRPVTAMTAGIFGTAPRELARAVTLQQTVEMVRTTIHVIEERVEPMLGEDDGPVAREAVLRFSREVAFAAADVYARAAEMRGAWDARLEALVVDSVLRGEADEAVRSRAAALGWASQGQVAVVLGYAPAAVASQSGPQTVIDELRRTARQVGLDALCAVQGDRLVVVLGGVHDLDKAGAVTVDHFGPGPVVVGPLAADLLTANASARAAVSGLRAARGWLGAPRPVAADDLLPERALAGDGHARHTLVAQIYTPLSGDNTVLHETASAFVDSGGSIEATARALYVHANTVRYRLRRISDITGLTPTNPRDAYTLRIAMTLGRLLS